MGDRRAGCGTGTKRPRQIPRGCNPAVPALNLLWPAQITAMITRANERLKATRGDGSISTIAEDVISPASLRCGR
jgi:hypothetical protein